MLQKLRGLFLPTVQFFQQMDKQHYAAIGIGVLCAAAIFPLVFRGGAGFREDFHTATKDPLLDRDYDFAESKWSHLKIALWLLLSLGCGILAFYNLPSWFPQWFSS